MRSSPSPALLLAALWACAPAPATETRSGVSGLIGASTSTTTDHPEAVAVLATYGGQGQVFCSGVQILPDVILTAGHCVSTFARARQQVGPSIRFWVSGEVELASVSRGFVPRDATEVVAEQAHPSWTSTQALDHDLGLLYLARVRDRAPVLPALVPVGAEAQVVPGLAVTVLGWGVERDEQNAPSDTKRVAQTHLGSVTDHYLGFGGPSRFGEVLACSGDSGGPVLVEREGTRFVVGISTRSDCLRYSAAIRPEQHRAFLTMALAESCQVGRRIACVQTEPTELSPDRFPRTTASALPAGFSDWIRSSCAHEAGSCTDRFGSEEECRVALGAMFQAASDPACSGVLGRATDCLSCLPSSCFSGCGACEDALSELHRCVRDPLPAPDAGLLPAPDAGLDAGLEVDAGHPTLDAGLSPEVDAGPAAAQASGCSDSGASGGTQTSLATVAVILLGLLRRRAR